MAKRIARKSPIKVKPRRRVMPRRGAALDRILDKVPDILLWLWLFSSLDE